jgi:hypothetical protein
MRGAIAGLVLVLSGAAHAAEAPPPVVLELFTSESCSSCPPADALLTRLKADPGLLPLSLHVDYWNRIGWQDRYSSRDFTARQYAYARTLGQDGVYTPELVVGGAAGLVGSDADAAASAILRARRDLRDPPGLSVSRQGSGLEVTVAAGEGNAAVVVVGYDDQHQTPVRSGENAGRTITETNVVRSLGAAARWTGAALDLHVPQPAGEHVAVLLQEDSGRILTAAAVP